MNGLSWLLYGAEVSSRVTMASGLLAGIAGIAMIFTVGAATVIPAIAAADNEPIPEPLSKMMSRLAKWNVAVFFVCLSLSWFLPSKNTLMLIAASEVGETVLASQDVQQMGGEAGALASDSLRLLRKYVNDQLGETAE